jgi:VanZ family protein
MTIILKLFAWCLAAAISFATLGPAGYRPRASSLGHDGEHALAFVLLGLAFGMAYTRSRLLTAAIAIALTGLIEILQLWAPGRHARLVDFLVDALAACVGLAAAAAFDWIIRRSQRRRAPAFPEPKSRGSQRPRRDDLESARLIDDPDQSMIQIISQ